MEKIGLFILVFVLILHEYVFVLSIFMILTYTGPHKSNLLMKEPLDSLTLKKPIGTVQVRQLISPL